MPPTRILAFFCFLGAGVLFAIGRDAWARGSAMFGVAFLVSPW